jgi:hypothetical protein
MPPTLISLAFMIEFGELTRTVMELSCSHHPFIATWSFLARYPVQVLRCRIDVRSQLAN